MPGMHGLGAHPPFDANAVRRDFPILNELVNGRPLIWLDNAATTQKPQSVIDRLTYFYQHENSNIHRAAHELAARATDAYEGARETVRRFLNAPSADEIVFRPGNDGGDQPRRPKLGPAERQRGGRSRHYLAGTPRQYCALAAVVQRGGGEIARGAGG